MKIGIGFDVHRLVSERKLILGGVEIQHEKGLLGHSDADVLLHAVIDALLGAAGLGDIGVLFPDTEQRFKGISSLELLTEVNRKIFQAGFEIGNIDAVIMAQRPKIRPHIPGMVEKMATVLQILPNSISIKATTTEKLGFVGREEGIAAEAVVLLNEIN